MRRRAAHITIEHFTSNLAYFGKPQPRGGSSKGTAGLQPPQNIPTVIYFCTKLLIIIDHDSTELKVQRNLVTLQKQRVQSP